MQLDSVCLEIALNRQPKWTARTGATAMAMLSALTLLATPGVAASASQNTCDQDGNTPGAIRACSDLIGSGQLDSATRSRVYFRRATAWLAEEEPAAAVSDFTRALAFDPTNIAAIEGRAKAYAILGQQDLAAADWSRLIAIKPADDLAYSGRADAKLAAGSSDDALADYTKAIELNANNRDAFLGRANVYDKLNQRDKVLNEFALILAIDPKYVPAHFAKAQAAERWGEKYLAIESYSAVLKYERLNQAARKGLLRLGVFNIP